MRLWKHEQAIVNGRSDVIRGSEISKNGSVLTISYLTKKTITHMSNYK